MLSATGKKEKLSASKGSEIEVSSNESNGNVWYRAILEENLAVSKRKKLSVRHLNPLSSEEDHSPSLITTAVHRLIRPLPPPDPSSPEEVDFEEGDMVDAAHRGGWWSGWVVKVLPGHRFLVYLKFEPDVIEVERKELRTHMVWEDEEWFRCEKRHLMKSEYSAGANVEVRTQVEDFGDIWVSAIAIMENEDGTLLLLKYKSLSGGEEEDEWTKRNVPYSEVRPPPPPFDLRAFGLMEHVDALLESGWCPSVVSMVLTGDRYTVLVGTNKESKDFEQSQLRPSMEWKGGAWLTKEKVSDEKESRQHAAEVATGSTRIRVKLRSTRSSRCTKNLPPPASPDVAEAGKESVTQLPQTPALSGDLASKRANAVVNGGNTLVSKQPEIAAETKEYHSSVVLGVAAVQLTKTTPRKKQTVMKNQKQAPEESSNRESVNKRKRGRQPRKFISTEPNQKQKTGVAANGTADMTDDDDQPLASWIHGGNSSSGQSAPRAAPPDPSVVEKHVVETPKAKDSTMVLPFAKKSPCWKVLESMEIFKAVPQRPHFSPLLQCEEESREGDAIGAMVNFTGLLEKLSNIQVDSSVSAINRIKESFLKLEKHGFDITAPLSRIEKLLSIKENQTWALEELQAAEREITENDNKRRKCEEDIELVSKKIVELQKQEALLKEAKVTMDKEIARMHTHAAVLDQKVQNVEEEFQATPLWIVKADVKAGNGNAAQSAVNRKAPSDGSANRDVQASEKTCQLPERHLWDQGTSCPRVTSVVNAMHNLSEVLVYECFNNGTWLKKEQLDNLDKVVENLTKCLNKSTGNKTIAAEASIPTQAMHVSCPNVVDLNEASNVVAKDREGFSVKPLDSFGLKELVDKDKYENEMTQSIKNILASNFPDGEENHPQTLLYKSLWLETEAALCSSACVAKYSRIKNEIDNLKLQNREISAGASTFMQEPFLNSQKPVSIMNSAEQETTDSLIKHGSNSGKDIVTMSHAPQSFRFNSDSVSAVPSVMSRSFFGGLEQEHHGNFKPDTAIFGKIRDAIQQESSGFTTEEKHIDVIDRFQILKQQETKRKLMSQNCSEARIGDQEENPEASEVANIGRSSQMSDVMDRFKMLKPEQVEESLNRLDTDSDSDKDQPRNKTQICDHLWESMMIIGGNSVKETCASTEEPSASGEGYESPISDWEHVRKDN